MTEEHHAETALQHECHTEDAAVFVSTDCDYKFKTTDPACSGCVLRDDG